MGTPILNPEKGPKSEENEPPPPLSEGWLHIASTSVCVCLCGCVLIDIDTDAVESYVAEETIEFLVNVEESVVDDE